MIGAQSASMLDTTRKEFNHKSSAPVYFGEIVAHFGGVIANMIGVALAKLPIVIPKGKRVKRQWDTPHRS